MTPHHALTAGTTAALCGAAAALMVSVVPTPAGLLAAGGLACYLVFLVWPWLCLPAGILGGAVTAGSLDHVDLPTVVLIHGGILLAGTLAILTRRLAGAPTRRRPRTNVDPLMLLLVVVIVLGAGYGLARGNQPYLVMVAAYQVAVIPAYFFLTTASLPDERTVERAGAVFTGALVVLAIAQLHNDTGLFATLALVPLLASTGATEGWRRVALLPICGVLAAAVLLSEYRTLWVTSALASLILLARGSARVRTTIGIALAAGGLLVLAGATLDDRIGDRWATVTAGLADSAGYRQAETAIGMRVWSEHPLLGAGLGQTSPGQYVEGLGLTDVGPTYHAFWMLVLANLGLVGLLAVLAPLLLAIRTGLAAAAADGPALGCAALLFGFLVSSTFAGPTDGHWELGLLAALAMLAGRPTRNPLQERNEPCLLASGPPSRTPAPDRPALPRPRSW